MEIIDKIVGIKEELDKLQEYFKNLPNDLSTVDSKISDLQHYIEYNKMNAFECYRLIKEMKCVLEERRKIKNDMEISRVFTLQQNKLISTENRTFLINDLFKTAKKLNSIYKNRVYSDDELNHIINSKNVDEIKER